MKLKDDQVNAIATKMDTIVHFLKAKDFESAECEVGDKIGLHQLDDSKEYFEKVDFLLLNENDWKIVEECEVDNEDVELAILDCPLCEKKTLTELINLEHL